MKRKTRGNGTGTAFKRGKTWTGMRSGYSYVVDGRLIRKRPTKGGFATKKEALEWANARTADIVPPKLIELWQGYAGNDLTKLSTSKQTAYRIARQRLEPLMGRRIDSLTIDELQECVNESCSSYYPARDMKNLLSNLYKRAQANNSGLTIQNLSTHIVLPDLEEKESTPFNKEEINKFWISYTTGDSFVGYILLMIYSGMMPAELLACRKSMVDLDACEIRGCGAKTKARKTSSIVFPDFMKPVLSELLGLNDKDKLLCINKDRFYVEYYKALERCGVRRLPPYSCRHTYGTESVKLGLHPAIIQRLLRHSNARTQEKYTHLAQDDLHDAANRLKSYG